MVKYMRIAVFSIAALLGLGTVCAVTYNKLGTLSAKKLAEPYEFVSLRDRERQLRCMADNIYYEAASEPAEGKIAVAQVVMNRVASGQFPTDPCKVIYQRNVFYSSTVCQFTWYCDGSVKRRPVNPTLYEESMLAAKMVLMEGFRLPGLKDAMFYHATYVNPNWKKQKVAVIGQHIFYK